MDFTSFDYRPLVSIFAALVVALVAFQLAGGLKFSLGGKSAASRLEGYAVADRRGLTDKLGDTVMARLGLDLDDWKFQMRWAKFGGKYEGQTVGSVLGQSLLFAGLGVAYIVLFQAFSPFFMIIVLIAAYYPYMTLRGRADDVRKAVKRLLPEAAAFIAAEMSAGSSAETALTRASNLPGSLGIILREAVGIAQQSGRLIFSRDNVPGVLVEFSEGLRMAHLVAFASQLDLVASKGAEGPRQMGEIARSLAREYRSDVTRQAEQMDNKLLFPMTFFFFIPFMAAVFIPLFMGILETF